MSMMVGCGKRGDGLHRVSDYYDVNYPVLRTCEHVKVIVVSPLVATCVCPGNRVLKLLMKKKNVMEVIVACHCHHKRWKVV